MGTECIIYIFVEKEKIPNIRKIFQFLFTSKNMIECNYGKENSQTLPWFTSEMLRSFVLSWNKEL